MRRSIYVVEDHPIFREGILAQIERTSDLEIIGYSESEPEAFEACTNLKPDLVTVDIGLAKGSGLDFISRIKSYRPEQKVLVLTALDERIYALRALRLGVSGFVMKREAASTLVEAIRAVLDGRLYIDEDLQRAIVTQPFSSESSETAADLSQLSNRELEVYRLMGTGASTTEIGAMLSISPKTVESYRANIKNKLGLASVRDIVRHAVASEIESRLGST